MESGHVIKVGDKMFTHVDCTTMLQDVYFWKRAKRAGLRNLSMQDGESADDFAVRIAEALVESEDMFELIAATVVPADPPGQTWTPLIAKETARYFAGLTSSEAKAGLQAVMVGLVIGFFERGLTSVWTSPSSLKAAKAGAVTPEKTLPRTVTHTESGGR